MQTVGAYETKTPRRRLLDAVARGETITKHGVPVALLGPAPEPVQPDVDAIIDDWLDARKGFTFRDDLTIRDMIEEGRR